MLIVKYNHKVIVSMDVHYVLIFTTYTLHKMNYLPRQLNLQLW